MRIMESKIIAIFILLIALIALFYLIRINFLKNKIRNDSRILKKENEDISSSSSIQLLFAEREACRSRYIEIQTIIQNESKKFTRLIFVGIVIFLICGVLFRILGETGILFAVIGSGSIMAILISFISNNTYNQAAKNRAKVVRRLIVIQKILYSGKVLQEIELKAINATKGMTLGAFSIIISCLYPITLWLLIIFIKDFAQNNNEFIQIIMFNIFLTTIPIFIVLYFRFRINRNMCSTANFLLTLKIIFQVVFSNKLPPDMKHLKIIDLTKN
jgi:hypothetical protein